MHRTVFGSFSDISKGFVIQKQVKIDAGGVERRFGVIVMPFSGSKMIQVDCRGWWLEIDINI